MGVINNYFITKDTSDPYVKVMSHGKNIYKTKKIKNTLSPKWNESFTMKIVNGNQPCWLQFQIIDHNKISDNILLADCVMNVWDYINPTEKTSLKDFWIDKLRGGPGKLHLSMSFNPS